MKDEEVVGKKEKRTLFGKLFHLAVVAATLYGAIKAIAAFVRRLTRKVEEDNPWCDRKRYLAIGNEKNLNLSGEKMSYAEVYGVGAAVQMDLIAVYIGFSPFACSAAMTSSKSPVKPFFRTCS